MTCARRLLILFAAALSISTCAPAPDIRSANPQTPQPPDGAVSCAPLPAAPRAGEPRPTADEYKGICTTISTAWSLTQDLEKVDGSVAGVDTDNNGTPDLWKRDFLESLRKVQKHDPNSGTPWETIPAAYAQYGGQCDAYVDAPTDAPGFANWCDALIANHESTQPNKDCHFFLRSDGGVPDAWAHDMHLTGISKNATTGACDIEVIDTSTQGYGGGGDVPINQTPQLWHVSAGTPLAISIEPGSSEDKFWAAMKPPATRARFLCCQ